MKEKTKEIISVVIPIGVIIFVAWVFLVWSNSIILAEDYNPFDEIRETEERVFINGTILHVEYIDWEYCELFMNDGSSHYFHKTAFGELKKFEGRSVTIMCYTQAWDGYYRLFPCNYDWDMGYIKPYTLE